MANKVRRAHLTVQEAIADWRRQFPILNSPIRSTKVARIVVCCAALYNLSRTENEPPFVEDGPLIIKREREEAA